MALESTTVFEARVKALSLHEFWDKFQEFGWTTIGDFAFAANCSPGQSDETTFITEVVVKLTGDADHPRKSALRRLFFECYSQCAADIQARTSQTGDEDRPRKLPKLEREQRMRELREKLKESMDIEGDTEPSNALVDKAYTMFDSGEVRFLRWDEITKRESEQSGAKTEPIWKVEKGVMRQSEVVVEDPADVSTELQLQFALKRRGVALHVAKVMSFSTHEKIAKFLMKALNAPPLPNYAKVSLEQLHQADQAIFARASRLTGAGIPLDTDGSPALDTIIPGILLEHDINCLVTRLPRSAASSGEGKRSGSQKRDAEVERLQAEVKRLRANTSQPQKGQGRGKGGNGVPSKGEGKGGKAARTKKGAQVPFELTGLKAKNAAGENLCFAYNKGQCDRQVNVCKFGLQNCMACGQKHSAIGSDGTKCSQGH